MRAALQRAWVRRGALAWLLFPVSLVYGTVARVRRALYAAGVLHAKSVNVPVVVVGNVVAGGAGKTPVVIELVAHLKSRGLRPGVVARGYGRSTDDCREVHVQSRAADAGDEALLVKRRTGVPVFVSTKRAEAAARLLGAYPDTQVIVSDDGLQHYALARDVEICVFDARGAGNGFLLPAGPLREPWPRAVDFILGAAGHGAGRYGVTRRLSEVAQRGDGTRIPVVDIPLQGRPVKALAGIANPEAFFSGLRERGLELAHCEALPDHYDFAQPRPATESAFTLVCTEKDAVKLWQQQPDAWAVPLEVRIDAAFFAAFDRVLDAKLSSRVGG